jgi:hypothetical protein
LTASLTALENGIDAMGENRYERPVWHEQGLVEGSAKRLQNHKEHTFQDAQPG